MAREIPGLWLAGQPTAWALHLNFLHAPPLLISTTPAFISHLQDDASEMRYLKESVAAIWHNIIHAPHDAALKGFLAHLALSRQWAQDYIPACILDLRGWHVRPKRPVTHVSIVRRPASTPHAGIRTLVADGACLQVLLWYQQETHIVHGLIIPQVCYSILRGRPFSQRIAKKTMHEVLKYLNSLRLEILAVLLAMERPWASLDGVDTSHNGAKTSLRAMHSSNLCLVHG